MKRKAQSAHGINKRVLRKTSLDEIAEDSLWEIMEYLSREDLWRWKQTSKFYSANKGSTAWLKCRLRAYVTKEEMREYTEPQLTHLFKKITCWSLMESHTCRRLEHRRVHLSGAWNQTFLQCFNAL